MSAPTPARPMNAQMAPAGQMPAAAMTPARRLRDGEAASGRRTGDLGEHQQTAFGRHQPGAADGHGSKQEQGAQEEKKSFHV